MKTMWAELASDYAVINAQASSAGVDTANLVSAFTGLMSIVTNVLKNMGENSSIDRFAFDTKITEYYRLRAEVLRNITNKKALYM